ncbi:hypothetical protein KOW79_007577 [Hemibagrus wyckioides]|uniref:Uncharacterized protein n=1 Tax=Hemibagrus wyckioides TaxID=337641 RepID=A0A9D3SS25_9TELE|nr:hypothetical protein KOW79_007577 [Hemibagrus wyckioides]
MTLSAREKGEEAVFTEGAAEPAASSGPVSEEVAGPSGKEVRLTQAEGGSSDLTPGESLTAGQVTPAVGAPSGEEQASWPGLGLEAGLFGIWAEATEGGSGGLDPGVTGLGLNGVLGGHGGCGTRPRAGYGGGRQTLRVWSYHRGGGGRRRREEQRGHDSRGDGSLTS